MGKSFATKSILEVTVGVTEVEMVDLVRSLWDEAVRANLRCGHIRPKSFVEFSISFGVQNNTILEMETLLVQNVHNVRIFQ